MKESEIDAHIAYLRGYVAFIHELCKSDNPYNGGILAECWIDGHEDARKDYSDYDFSPSKGD